MKRYVAGITVLFALFSTALISQNKQVAGTANLTGTITDPTSATVASAAVDLKNDLTGALLHTVANSTGTYEFKALRPGAYAMTVAVPGFKTYTRTGLQLPAGSTTRVDVRLEVGSTSESVSVSADASLLKTEAAQTGTVVVNGQPANLPILGMGQQGMAKGGGNRDAMAMSQMVPGVAFQGRFDARVRIEIERRDRENRGRYPTPNNEEYGHFVENEFTTPSADPLSTFGADVDTASYSNMRRFLHEGQLPPAESVRIEELINYFSYDYPLPERGKPVSVTTHLMRSPWNSQRLLMHVGLRTQPLAAEDLPPSNLTFLIDVSGSMAPADRLPLIQQALQMLVRQLRPQDKVALVVYAGSSGVVLPPTGGDQQDRILDAIGRLQAGGSTNGAEGIRLAYDMARQAFSKKANNRVILATDGDFNVGVRSDDELVRLIEDERKSGIFLSVFGVGRGNLKDSKMEKLADHGNGTFAYLDSLSEARKVFVQEMGATLVTVAKDVKLQIEFNPARVKEYRLVGYENRLLRPEDFNDDTKDAGDLGAGHQVTAFYEIIPAGSEASGNVDSLRYQEARNEGPVRGGVRTSELAWVKMRYKAPQADTSELLQWPVSSGVSDFRSVPRDVRFAAAVAEYGMLLRHSKYAGTASFGHVLTTASEATGADLAGHRTEFLDLVRRSSQLSQR